MLFAWLYFPSILLAVHQWNKLVYSNFRSQYLMACVKRVSDFSHRDYYQAKY
jgi:hypothetical protein